MIKFLNRFNFSYTVWMIILGTFLSRFGTAIVLPYITIFLVHNKGLPLYWAGCAVGIGYLAQALTGFAGGFSSTRINHFTLLKITVLIYAAVFLCMGLSCQFIKNQILVGIAFIGCSFLGGICRSFIETIGQIIISDFTELDQKHSAFSIRYFFINVAVSIGPLIAFLLGITSTTNAFWVTTIFVFLYFAVIQFTIKPGTIAPKVNSHSLSFSKLITALLLDKQFLYFTICGVLIFLGFGQLETMFSYVSFIETGDAHVFAIMFLINGLTIVLFQLHLIDFIRRFDVHDVISVGVVFLVLGLLGVAFAGKVHFYYYLSMFVLTLGEILSISVISIYIDLMAPVSYKEIYFGITSFVLIGRVIGAPLATWTSHCLGLRPGMVLIAGITLLAVPMIWSAKKAKLKQDSVRIQAELSKEIR